MPEISGPEPLLLLTLIKALDILCADANRQTRIKQ